jgi:hypothetical protein
MSSDAAVHADFGADQVLCTVCKLVASLVNDRNQCLGYVCYATW